MQKLLPKISLVFWSIWFAIDLVTSIMWLHDYFSGGFLRLIILWRNLGLRASGIALSALLCKRPNRKFALILAGVSLFELWVGYLGTLFFSTVGGMSPLDFLADWWRHNTHDILLALRVFPFLIFLSISIVTWPIYAMLYGSGETDTQTK
jgi:hypothetical protein